MELIDTHCHLDHEYFKNDREQVVERARAAGVKCWVNPSLQFKNIPMVLALTEQHEDCYAGVGVYPRYCKDWQSADIDRVRQAAQHKKVVAIGEIGLDYSFNIKSSKETQFAVLTAHLALAAELGLPVLLHNRNLQTYADTLRLVAESPLVGQERIGVLHHFNADYDTARRALDLGLYLSFAGPVTYPNAKKLPALVARLPLDRLLIETDAPYMPPHPYRSRKRSEPAHVRVIAETIAVIHKRSVEEIAQITTQNAIRLFDL
ncbi:MAG: TatD family hydrolase [Anaerolineae bacterium]|nr:TatD family hydrolase [Anaerolineae bacterium]